MKIKAQVPEEFKDSQAVQDLVRNDDQWRQKTPYGQLQSFLDQFGYHNTFYIED